MEPDLHRREALFSRTLSEYSVEESRPGYFNSSYIDDITSSHRDLNSSSARKRGASPTSSSSSRSQSPTTPNQIPVANTFLRQDGSHSPDYKWIGSKLTTVGEILGSMLLLVLKEYSVLLRDSDAPPSYPFDRNGSSVIQIEHDRDLRISDKAVHMALLNTVRGPKSLPPAPNGNVRVNRANASIPLVNNFDTSRIIEELESAITDFETTEVLCSHVLREMGLDTKPRDELFMVFTFLFCTREVARILLKLAKFQENLCRRRVKANRIWWPAMSLKNNLYYSDADEDEVASEQNDRDPYHPARIHRNFRYHLWQFLMWFRKPEFKFSVKFTLALCLTATPAFASSTYDWFLQVHGNWGLVTVCFVMNQTVGSTLSISIYRIIGTILGGFWGYLGWIASRGNPYIVAVFTLIIGVPCWFFYITRPQTKIHSVSIITYVVIMFSIYYTEVIQGQESPNSAFVLAVLRTANIIAAIVISLLVETLLWPYIARVELRKHLSATIYNLGVLFSRIMSIYMISGDMPAALEAKHEAKRLTNKLQSAMTKATALLAQSAQEPRLRDRFQEQVYADIIIKAQNLLDWSSTMYTSIVQTDDTLRVRLAKRLARRRKDVVATALLHFYVLSGALKSKSPLPPYLPSARVARLRLLNQIREMDIFQDLGSRAHDAAADGFVYTFWYSYTGSLIEIVEEQEELGDLIKQIVGEIEFADWDLQPNSDDAQATSIDISRMADADVGSD
ncbi:hypothetical protein K493DRAFT_363203 [Basidiobolus meristosporus CBS 931.73]|uniref:Uncharacterized protein n=1 Tax=Basidiobolus meristosporus CBS 931.73 TaxID=1314790 RepID=A0A1Y1WW16_9FUNG|nr:hypothetical protein K493DRAFT_363203 [Basidiobolus meristosporus CBS 931.73]|eukprot:ORX77751.1 hypothetical protein K493DRAFT_363203 [Basidiobolus meristosporus CBS 931.73]